MEHNFRNSWSCSECETNNMHIYAIFAATDKVSQWRLAETFQIFVTVCGFLPAVNFGKIHFKNVKLQIAGKFGGR